MLTGDLVGLEVQLLQLLVDLGDGLQLVEGQVQLHQRGHVEHAGRDPRVHQLVVGDSQVLQRRQLVEVAGDHAVDVVIVGVQDLQRVGDPRGQLLQLVVAHVQRQQPLGALEGAGDRLRGQLVVLQVHGGQVLLVGELAGGELGELVVHDLEFLQRLGGRDDGLRQLVAVEVQLLQGTELVDGALGHLAVGEQVVVQDQPAEVGGHVVEHARLDLVDLVVLQVQILDASGHRGDGLQLAVVAVHGGGEADGAVALPEAVGPRRPQDVGGPVVIVFVLAQGHAQ